jgi:hypothetical protein
MWFYNKGQFHGSIIGGGGVLAIIGVVLTLRGQRETRRLADERNRFEQGLADERNRLELQERRRQICVPLLITVREFAPVVAEFRSKVHDDLWERQQHFLFQSRGYAKRVNAIFATANKRIAIATSELSIDPAGQKVKDTFIAYLKAQDNYAKAMVKPMRRFPKFVYGKADPNVLDELAERANEQVTALEEANSPPDTDHSSQGRQPGALAGTRHLIQVIGRWRKRGTSSGQTQA